MKTFAMLAALLPFAIVFFVLAGISTALLFFVGVLCNFLFPDTRYSTTFKTWRRCQKPDCKCQHPFDETWLEQWGIYCTRRKGILCGLLSAFCCAFCAGAQLPPMPPIPNLVDNGTKLVVTQSPKGAANPASFVPMIVVPPTLQQTVFSLASSSRWAGSPRPAF